MLFFNKKLSQAIMTRPNYAIFSYKIGVKKIKCVIENKETFLSSFKKNKKKI